MTRVDLPSGYGDVEVHDAKSRLQQFYLTQPDVGDEADDQPAFAR